MEPETPSALTGPSSGQQLARLLREGQTVWSPSWKLPVDPVWCLLRTSMYLGLKASKVLMLFLFVPGSFRVTEAQRGFLLASVSPAQSQKRVSLTVTVTPDLDQVSQDQLSVHLQV